MAKSSAFSTYADAIVALNIPALVQTNEPMATTLPGHPTQARKTHVFRRFNQVAQLISAKRTYARYVLSHIRFASQFV